MRSLCASSTGSEGQSDSLGAISWWMTANSWLGVAPSDLLGLGRDAEIEYAAEQLDNDNW